MYSQAEAANQGIGSHGSPEAPDVVKLESSHRLSPSISLHTFSVPKRASLLVSFQPSQNVTLQFPDDLDLIYGSKSLKEEDRCLTFTPCQLSDSPDADFFTMSVITRNGRVTGLLGIPRPHGRLTAKVVGTGGGFSTPNIENIGFAICIAGGTGIAPFLAMTNARWGANGCPGRVSLIWSINGNDFPLVEYLVRGKILQSIHWLSVTIFVTKGDDLDGLVAGKTEGWWAKKISEMRVEIDSSIQTRFRRMEMEDLNSMISNSDHQVLFCGSKSLEWQVRMWCLNKCQVVKTELS
ncbi:unnamed protein product [Clonostachys rhizophaga]|uniref:FAD-binding FR-type domain-containing protein n=1 Tax=Clonostachys rhizophaga TaxID=160324 RepID=A0A9N9YN61_9HYPO|nr:unnamed protein product [Clonostachys rhizophaga]